MGVWPGQLKGTSSNWTGHCAPSMTRETERWLERRGDRSGGERKKGRQADRQGDRRHKAVAGSVKKKLFFPLSMEAVSCNGNSTCDCFRTQLFTT